MLAFSSLEGIVGHRTLLREIHLAGAFFLFFGPAIIALSADRRSMAADVAAVCVPPPLARDISYTPALPERRARLLANLPMAPSVKFHAVYQSPFWRGRGLSGQAWTAKGPVGLTYDNSPDDGTGRGGLVGLVVADEARYRMLETIRRYAVDRLTAAGELAAACDRHLDYYLGLVEAAAPELDRDKDAWRARMEPERDNLRAALEWGLAQEDPARRHDEEETNSFEEAPLLALSLKEKGRSQ